MSVDAEEPDLEIHPPKKAAAGVAGVRVALQCAYGHMGARRSLATLTKLNQVGGFDCMSCAWPDPDPDHRGVEKGRRVVLLHRDDIAALGFDDGDRVDHVGVWKDDIERVAENFRIVRYDTPRGSAAAYYPETNPLVPLDSTAEYSNTSTSKGVVIILRSRWRSPDEVRQQWRRQRSGCRGSHSREGVSRS
jgi:hypothetical protein